MKKSLMNAIIFVLGVCTCLPSFGMEKAPEQDGAYEHDRSRLILSLRKCGAIGLGLWGGYRAFGHFKQAFTCGSPFSCRDMGSLACTAGLLCGAKLLWTKKSFAESDREVAEYLKKRSPEQALVDFNRECIERSFVFASRKSGALCLAVWGVDHLFDEQLAGAPALFGATILWGESADTHDRQMYERSKKVLATSSIDAAKCAADPACSDALQFLNKTIKAYEEKFEKR